MGKALQYDQILEQFENGQVGWRETMEALKRMTVKPWQTTAWRNRRMEVLGQKCETCGSDTPPLVIQHRRTPIRVSELVRYVRDQLRSEYAQSHPLKYKKPRMRPQEWRQSCPECSSVNIRYRKEKGNWKCAVGSSYSHRKRCGAVFINPNTILYSKYTKEQWNAHEEGDQRWAWEQAFREAYEDRICEAALRLSFKEHERYVALLPEDIATLCRRCAFLEDRAAGLI